MHIAIFISLFLIPIDIFSFELSLKHFEFPTGKISDWAFENLYEYKWYGALFCNPNLNLKLLYQVFSVLQLLRNNLVYIPI